MIYPTVPFPVTLSDTRPRFQGHGVIFKPVDALSVLCAQLTRNLLAIAKFLFNAVWALTSGGFRIVSDTLVLCVLTSCLSFVPTVYT